MNIALTTFTTRDFDLFISWIDSPVLLVTIAGPVLTYPVTKEQLQRYLDDKKSTPYNIIDTVNGKVIGHSELIESGPNILKIDKLLIGDPAMRGKGIGEKVMYLLMQTAFNKPGIDIVELNVFEWNTAGRRCYEKCGFVENPSKKMIYAFGAEQWITLNMSINRKQFLINKLIN